MISSCRRLPALHNHGSIQKLALSASNHKVLPVALENSTMSTRGENKDPSGEKSETPTATTLPVATVDAAGEDTNEVTSGKRGRPKRSVTTSNATPDDLTASSSSKPEQRRSTRTKKSKVSSNEQSPTKVVEFPSAKKMEKKASAAKKSTARPPTTTTKKAPLKNPTTMTGGRGPHRIFTMPFAKVYPAYIAKAEKKGRSKAEVDTILGWLTGYTPEQLTQHLERQTDFQTFFATAPLMNPKRLQITGTICGVKLDSIDDPTMREIRYLDKLVDELAKGKAMNKILR
jgi:hypothetical protein